MFCPGQSIRLSGLSRIISTNLSKRFAISRRIPPQPQPSTHSGKNPTRTVIHLWAARGNSSSRCQGSGAEKVAEIDAELSGLARFNRNVHGWPPFFSPHDRFQPGFGRPPGDPMMQIAVKTLLRAMLGDIRVGAHDKWLAETLGQPTTNRYLSVLTHTNLLCRQTTSLWFSLVSLA